MTQIEKIKRNILLLKEMVINRRIKKQLLKDNIWNVLIIKDCSESMIKQAIKKEPKVYLYIVNEKIKGKMLRVYTDSVIAKSKEGGKV